MALTSSMNIDYYNSKTYASNNFRDAIYFRLRVRGIKRVCMRDATGRETLIQQTTMDMSEVKSQIIPYAFHLEDVCGLLVDVVLTDKGIHKCIRDFVAPEISNTVIKLNYCPDKIGARGIRIEAEVGFIEETWFREMVNHDDSDDRHIPTEQESCAICLEPLCENRIMKLLCSHGFHKKCIFQWLGKNLSCPICRYNDI